LTARMPLVDVSIDVLPGRSSKNLGTLGRKRAQFASSIDA
jgi:hypothetical protein